MKVGEFMQINHVIADNQLQSILEINKNSIYSVPNKNEKHKDKVDISEEGKKLSKEFEDFLRKIEDKKIVLEMLGKQKKDMEKDNPYEIKLKCFIISSRIMTGDKVPQKDINFLIENEPGMYFNALLLKKQKENPEKHKSLIEDDNEESEMDNLSNVKTGSGDTISQTENPISPEDIDIS